MAMAAIFLLFHMNKKEGYESYILSRFIIIILPSVYTKREYVICNVNKTFQAAAVIMVALNGFGYTKGLVFVDIVHHLSTFNKI